MIHLKPTYFELRTDTAQNNPNYNGDSIESINEGDTKLITSTFIEQTIGHLGKEFRRVQWAVICPKMQA